jgi:hypothetical protein
MKRYISALLALALLALLQVPASAQPNNIQDFDVTYTGTANLSGGDWVVTLANTSAIDGSDDSSDRIWEGMQLTFGSGGTDGSVEVGIEQRPGTAKDQSYFFASTNLGSSKVHCQPKFTASTSVPLGAGCEETTVNSIGNERDSATTLKAQYQVNNSVPQWVVYVRGAQNVFVEAAAFDLPSSSDKTVANIWTFTDQWYDETINPLPTIQSVFSSPRSWDATNHDWVGWSSASLTWIPLSQDAGLCSDGHVSTYSAAIVSTLIGHHYTIGNNPDVSYADIQCNNSNFW